MPDTEKVVPVILCGTDAPQPGSRPYYIGYTDMVDGYRHAWTETDRFGRKKIRRSRAANHPADPRCPECASSSTSATRDNGLTGVPCVEHGRDCDGSTNFCEPDLSLSSANPAQEDR